MKKRLLLIKIIGILFLIMGSISLFAAPAEFSSFYAFSHGGTFQYDGFGFGTLMYAVISISTLFYAALALICIPVGIGNIKLTNRGYHLSRILFILVMAIGIATTICIGLSFRLLDSFSVFQYIAIICAIILALIILPYFLLLFYKNKNTKQLFNSSLNTYFENQSEQKMLVVLLNLVWVMFFMVMIFLKGSFPLLGQFILKTPGTYLLSIVIFVLLVLNYLFYRNVRFTEYGMLIFYAFLILSVVITFIIIPAKDFIRILELPSYELQEMSSILKIISGINLGIFFGVLLIIQTICLLSGNLLNKKPK